MKNLFSYVKDLLDLRLGRTTPGEAAVRMDGEPLIDPTAAEECEAIRFRASHIEPIEDEK